MELGEGICITEKRPRGMKAWGKRFQGESRGMRSMWMESHVGVTESSGDMTRGRARLDQGETECWLEGLHMEHFLPALPVFQILHLKKHRSLLDN